DDSGITTEPTLPQLMTDDRDRNGHAGTSLVRSEKATGRRSHAEGAEIVVGDNLRAGSLDVLAIAHANHVRHVEGNVAENIAAPAEVFEIGIGRRAERRTAEVARVERH